jgi:hypothetical protein
MLVRLPAFLYFHSSSPVEELFVVVLLRHLEDMKRAYDMREELKNLYSYAARKDWARAISNKKYIHSD